MQHASFLTFSAKNNYELGLQLGETFGEKIQEKIHKAALAPNWTEKIERAKIYLSFTEKYFPQYIEELQGYAKASKVDFYEFWTRSLEEEIEIEIAKCTTIITNSGKLISHNEDWEANSQDLLYLIKRTIGDLSVFELFYFPTLGGSSISVNSHGFCQTINTLVHTDFQIGVPRHVTCRWLSETSNPEKDFEKMSTFPHSMGFNHNILSKTGKICNIEETATKQILTKSSSPYIHTNHYLSSLSGYENGLGVCGTEQRYAFAKSHVKPQMSIEEMETLNSDTSQGPNESLMNERTIGKMIVDFDEMVARVWLLREEKKGWVEYPLDFIK